MFDSAASLPGAATTSCLWSSSELPDVCAFRPDVAAAPRPRARILLGARRPGSALGLIVSLAFAPAATAEDRLTAWQRQQLEAGEVLVEMVAIPGTELQEGVARRVLDAPPERVFRAVRDHAHYVEFMPFVTASRATERPGEWELSLDLPWPSPDERFRISVFDSVGAGPRGEPLWHSSWRLVPGSGDVVENRGDWTLETFAPGRTLVTLRMRSDAGPPVPRGLQERGTRDSLPWVLDGLRQQVGRCRYDEPRKDGCGE